MTTTTTRPPSEEEVRAAIARAWHQRPPAGVSIDVLFSDAFTPMPGLLEGLWDPEELRPAERDRLLELAVARLDAIEADAHRRIVEALVAAALAFAAEHPDAPRAGLTA